ncbi:MAG: T9SS type A sorting domain-containing protein, partial [Calditrichaeota bacterium]|nr:T9SS type A sorting domain-containing protein [Calditrichota bacterium]
GIAHDGVDMWQGGDYRGQLWYIYDDGDAECYWMSISPRAGGDLQPNQDMDVFITLDARRLTIGLWETDIHVLSDDPDNPDIEVAVMLDVIGENVNERNNVILPELIELSAYPNPFNSTTTIKYNIPYPSNVSLQVYNLSGQRITTLFNGNQIAGFHSNILTATDLPSGLYFVKLNAGGQVFTRKLMLVK